jgi:hypothetical protein
VFKKTEIEDFVKIVDSEIIAKKLPKGKTLSEAHKKAISEGCKKKKGTKYKK